jgi:hypothetical protein
VSAANLPPTPAMTFAEAVALGVVGWLLLVAAVIAFIYAASPRRAPTPPIADRQQDPTGWLNHLGATSDHAWPDQ